MVETRERRGRAAHHERRRVDSIGDDGGAREFLQTSHLGYAELLSAAVSVFAVPARKRGLARV